MTYNGINCDSCQKSGNVLAEYFCSVYISYNDDLPSTAKGIDIPVIPGVNHFHFYGWYLDRN